MPVKLPFPLTLGFKSMLQRGIETQDMDVRWVSSLSWYFLNFFGLNGLYRLMLGNDNGPSSPSSSLSRPRSLRRSLIITLAAAVQQDMLMSPYGNPAASGALPGGQGAPQDFGKLFKAEKDNLALADGLYKWSGADVELRVLRKYGRISLAAAAAANAGGGEEEKVGGTSTRGKAKVR